MMNFFKSDLTYSLGGGFIAGALMLCFMQPEEQRSDPNPPSTVSAAAQTFG
ncbi:hypothetical protein [Parasphingorhabdus sp.]|uniref:hypothetical protein n=1 Tax=Parasphingorhabdus sp. TaxID=2709688 RepID=UPI003263BAEB